MNTQRINELKELISETKERIEALEGEYTRDDYDNYDQMLNDCYGEIQVCGHTYEASEVFKAVDPIAYDVGMNDYTSAELSDKQTELEELEQELKELQEEQ